MKNEIKTYFGKINDLISNNSSKGLEEAIKIHLTKISFFQHERLIHLLVTLAFALLEMLSLIFLFTYPSLLASVLTLLFFILLIPYIFHYYFLENTVQAMYKQYDKLIEKKNTP